MQLATRRALRGEKRVWEALHAAPLPAATRVFYNRAPKGCRRRADMLIIHPERGIIAIEVKSTALGLNPIAIPQAAMLALPAMRRDAFPFAPGPHMLTAEDLAPAELARKLDALLPRLDPATCAALAPALETVATALTRPGDAPVPW